MKLELFVRVHWIQSSWFFIRNLMITKVKWWWVSTEDSGFNLLWSLVVMGKERLLGCWKEISFGSSCTAWPEMLSSFSEKIKTISETLIKNSPKNQWNIIHIEKMKKIKDKSLSGFKDTSVRNEILSFTYFKCYPRILHIHLQNSLRRNNV